MRTFLSALSLIALLGGCAVGPDYHRPAALLRSPLSATFGNAAVANAGEWKIAEPSAQTVALAHEQTVIQLRGQRLASSASLIKALGAGWRNADSG